MVYINATLRVMTKMDKADPKIPPFPNVCPSFDKSEAILAAHRP
jgi:hypothetical protein